MGGCDGLTVGAEVEARFSYVGSVPSPPDRSACLQMS